MKAYLDLLRHVREHGRLRGDRTGTGTRSVFGYQLRVDLSEGFPLLTTKKVHTKSVVNELLWFMKGETHVEWLQERGVTIWDEWATAEQTARFGREAGDLGPVYGHQWRNFGATRLSDGSYARDGVDQLANVVAEIQRNPESRRLIVSGWHPGEADQVALPPCHTLFQFYVADGRLSCQLYQRSADVFLGVPFNIASYALLTAMVAQVTGLGVGDFVHTFGDVHLYRNHEEQADLQLSRGLRPLPTLWLDPSVTRLEDFEAQHVRFDDYDPHPAIKAPVAVMSAGPPQHGEASSGAEVSAEAETNHDADASSAPAPALPPLGLVVARATPSHAIGRSNQLVFRIKEDLQHFKRTTLGHPVLMGRKTFESIGRPLPGRTNVVLSRDPTFQAEGVTVCASLDDALAAVADEAMPYVIGGGELYRQALPRVTQLVLTEVVQDVSDADTFFTYDEGEFRVAEERAGETPGVTFLWLERVVPLDQG